MDTPGRCSMRCEQNSPREKRWAFLPLRTAAKVLTTSCTAGMMRRQALPKYCALLVVHPRGRCKICGHDFVFCIETHGPRNRALKPFLLRTRRPVGGSDPEPPGGKYNHAGEDARFPVQYGRVARRPFRPARSRSSTYSAAPPEVAGLP